VDVVTEADRTVRLAELRAGDRDQAAAAEAAKRNEGFVQVYDKGWRRIRELIQANPQAARLYAYLAQHIDPACGAVVASQELLAEELGVSRRTIIRHAAYLEEVGALVKIKVGGLVWAYALDPTEVWRSWEDKKATAAFITRTLVKRQDRANGHVKRRLMVMLGQPELPLVETGDKPPFLR